MDSFEYENPRTLRTPLNTPNTPYTPYTPSELNASNPSGFKEIDFNAL